MNINPHSCPHLSLTYDGTFAIVRCLDCDTTWDADEPIPMHKRETRVCLNPDNEPTSEHMQWSEDNGRI